MGIVLKRRDNATVVKTIYGGAIKILLNKRDIPGATQFVKEKTRELVDGRMSMNQLIISKSLRAEYKTATLPAHKQLADRMAARDPGNAPQLNDRIPFVAIEVKDKKGVKLLQGNRIEHPDYIIENKLKIDYLFYLTNQIINPATQFLELIMKPTEVDNIFREFIISEENRRKGIQSLNKFGISIIKTNKSQLLQ
jgi:DNA polymerase elongation subunit (family B)